MAIRLAIVNKPSAAIDHTGHGITIKAGSYPVADLDGTAERGEAYVTLNGKLVQINSSDPAITYAHAGDPFFHPGLPPEMLNGFVVGECGHRVAGSEWRAGFRVCERCQSPEKG